MKRFSTSVILFSIIFAAICASKSQAGNRAPLAAYEMPRTHVAPIKDTKNGRQYELYIKLPEDYSENSDVKYPVIYITDAVFHMDMLSGATEYLMPNVILAGISFQTDLGDEGPPTSRFRDYMVTEVPDPEIQARFQPGQASRHLDFIRNDVIPFIETRYRTLPSERSYFGYSLSGAFGAYILLAEPDTFKNYILGSPAFNQLSLQYIDEFETETAPRQDEMNASVFVSLGELEESEEKEVGHFVSVLRRRSEAGLTLTGLERIADSNHGQAFPETVIRSVRWLADMNSEFINLHNEEN